MRFAALLLAGLLALAPLSLAAQTQPSGGTATEADAIDYTAWEAEVARAENLIANARASTAFLENLRASLSAWRARFVAAQADAEARIAAIETQLAALGPPPAEGATEADGVADRRAALNEQMSQAQLPRIDATSAAVQAAALISDLEAILRNRQQEEFLELDPSPANPGNWPAALTSLRDVFVAMQSETATRLSDPVRRSAAADDAPLILLYLLIGLVALVRGRHWTKRLTLRLQARAHERGLAAGTFAVSLTQVAVPVIGVILILLAVVTSGMVGSQGVAFLSSLGQMVITTFVALWLAGRLFPDGSGPLGTLELDETQKASVRRATGLIGVLLGAGIVITTVSDFNQVLPEARGVMTLPVFVLMGLSFWRFARFLNQGLPEAAPDDGKGFARGAVLTIAKALQVLGLIGPVLALIGYNNAAEAIMLPTAMTLGILAILVALQPLIRDLYAIVFRTTNQAASEALLPVLLNFGLVFCAIPLVLLAWGMRFDALALVYTRFWEGADLGGVRVTPGTVIAVLVIFAAGMAVTRLLQGALKTAVLPRTKLDAGARNAVNSGVGYVGIALAAVIAISAGGIDLTALGVVVGALSVGIGFGLQNVVNNFVSGIILLIERPISEGDWIEVNGNMGIVKSISVRSTRIETFDKTDVIVPNGDFISGTVTNWTRGNTIGRAVVTVGVAYGTDTRRVHDILLEIARAHPDVSTFPEPGVDFLGFGADSLDFRIRMILRDVNKLLAVKNEVHHQIAERFVEEGIEIPFAQRDIWLRNPEALRPGGGEPEPLAGPAAPMPGAGTDADPATDKP
jgi:small-conductance mechanosensitive channel